MTKTEKISNAKKRIDELERLIRYWNDSEQSDAKIVNFSMKIENKFAQNFDDSNCITFQGSQLFNVFDYSYYDFLWKQSN